MLKSPPPTCHHQPPRGPDALSRAGETRTPIPRGKLLPSVSPAEREGDSYRHAWLTLRNPVLEPMVLGGHRLCDVDREAEDGWIDGRTDARLPHSGQEPTLGPSTEAVGPGVPLHRSELQTKTHPTLFLANRESLFPNCACVRGGKALPIQTHRVVALGKHGRIEKRKAGILQFYFKKRNGCDRPCVRGQRADLQAGRARELPVPTREDPRPPEPLGCQRTTFSMQGPRRMLRN